MMMMVVKMMMVMLMMMVRVMNDGDGGGRWLPSHHLVKLDRLRKNGELRSAADGKPKT